MPVPRAEELCQDREPLDYASQPAAALRLLDRPMRIACLACGGVGSLAFALQSACALTDNRQGVTTTIGDALRVFRQVVANRRSLSAEQWLYLVPTVAAFVTICSMPVLLTIGLRPSAFASRRRRVVVRATALLLGLTVIGEWISLFDSIVTSPGPLVSTRTFEAIVVGSAAIAMRASFAILLFVTTLTTTPSGDARRLAITLCFAMLAFGAIASPGGLLLLSMPPHASELAVVDHWPGRIAAWVATTDYGDSSWSLWPMRLIGVAAAISAIAAFVRPRDRVALWAMTAIPLVVIACVAVVAEAFDSADFLANKSHRTWRIAPAVIGNDFGDAIEPCLLLAFAAVSLASARVDSASARSRY